jgi:hypothetical protein
VFCRPSARCAADLLFTKAARHSASEWWAG